MNGYWNRCTALPINGSECRTARRSPYLSRLTRTQVLSRLARPQHLSRLASPAFIPLGANPAFIPLGEPSIYPAWREPSIYPAWRESSIYPAWRVQHLSRLAGPVFIPLGSSRRNRRCFPPSPAAAGNTSPSGCDIHPPLNQVDIALG